MSEEMKNYYLRMLLAWFLLMTANIVIKSAQATLKEAAAPKATVVVEVESEPIDAVPA